MREHAHVRRLMNPQKIMTSISLLGLMAFALSSPFLCRGSEPTTSAIADSGVIAGQVFDEKGDPVICEVRVFRETVTNGQSVLEQDCTVTSDESGVFTCARLRPGSYLIRSDQSRSYGNASKTTWATTYAFGYYADARDIVSAVRVLLAPQGAQWVDVLQRQIAGYYVTGSVAARNVVGSVSFHLAEVSSNGESIEMKSHAVYEPQTENFELESVPNGSYVLQASWITHDDNDLFVSTRGEISFAVNGKDISDLRIVGRSITTLEGTIESVGSFGRSAVRSITLRDTSGLQEAMTVSVDPNGKFQVPVLLDGIYAVSIPPSSAFIKRVSVAGILGNDYELIVLPGHPWTSAKIEIGTDASYIAGILNRCQGQATPCGVVAKSDATGVILRSDTDSQGRFVIGGIAPGLYRLYAWKDMTNIPYADAIFLQDLPALMVDVGEGDAAYGMELTPLDAP